MQRPDFKIRLSLNTHRAALLGGQKTERVLSGRSPANLTLQRPPNTDRQAMSATSYDHSSMSHTDRFLAKPDKKLIQKDINRKFLLTKRYDVSSQSEIENKKIQELQARQAMLAKQNTIKIGECKQIVGMCEYEQKCVKNFLINIKNNDDDQTQRMRTLAAMSQRKLQFS